MNENPAPPEKLLREQVMNALLSLTADPRDLESLQTAARLMQSLPNLPPEPPPAPYTHSDQQALFPLPNPEPPAPPGWISLLHLTPTKITGTKPSRLRLPGQNEANARRWIEVMLQCVDWLRKSHLGPRIRIPARSQAGRLILARENDENIQGGGYRKVGESDLYFTYGASSVMLRDLQTLFYQAQARPEDYPIVMLA